MFFSAYQIESLLEDIQKNIFPVEKSSSETLSISEDAFDDSRRLYKTPKSYPFGDISPEKINDLIEDKTTYEPIVNFVQQSRAGLFVSPTYIPENPAPPFSLVNDFSQREIEVDRQKKGELPISLNNNSPDRTKIDIIEKEVKVVSKKEKKLDKQINLNEENSTKLKNLKNNYSADQLLKDLDSEDLFEETISLSAGELKRVRYDDDNDVVFGEGLISKNSIHRFVFDYPESAIKFLLRKNLDGRPLPLEYEKIYQKWEKRGLSRGKLKNFLLKLMNWEEFPDIPMLDILRTIREYLFDIRKGKNE